MGHCRSLTVWCWLNTHTSAEIIYNYMNRLPYFSVIDKNGWKVLERSVVASFNRCRILTEMFNFNNSKFGKYFIINFKRRELLL